MEVNTSTININIGSGLKNKKTVMIKIAIALGVLVTATLLMKKTGMSYRQSILKTMYPAIMWSSKAAGKKQGQGRRAGG